MKERQPGYWMNETGGKLRLVVRRYLNGVHLSREDIGIMRAYLRQWMTGDFRGPEADDLRLRVDAIVDMKTLSDWLNDAFYAGVDPL